MPHTLPLTCFKELSEAQITDLFFFMTLTIKKNNKAEQNGDMENYVTVSAANRKISNSTGKENILFTFTLVCLYKAFSVCMRISVKN